MSKQQKYSDQENVLLLQQGDKMAFNELFICYGTRLYHFAHGYLKSKEDAEGVVQEVFLVVWRNRKDLKTKLSFKAYIFKIAYHLIIEVFNKKSKQNYYKEDLIEEVTDDRVDIDEQLNYQMLLNQVELAIDRLPSRQREILILKRKEGYSLKEIAAKLGISPKTVENHLTEGLRSLKKNFSDLQF